MLHPTYTALLDDFHPQRAIGIFSGDRVEIPAWTHHSSMATCIRALLPLASRGNDMLDRSIFCLLAMYYGRLHGNAGLVALARTNYADTLTQYRRLLSDTMAVSTPESSRSHLVFLFASLALQLFEHLSDIEVYGTGHVAHLDGVLGFLQNLEPRTLQQSRDLRMAFSGFRGMAVYVTIERRKPNFLADSTWLHLPFQESRKTKRDRLIELGLQIPGLLNRADQILLKVQADVLRPEDFVDQALLLLNDVSTLRKEFEQWLYELKVSTPGPLYWMRGEPTANVAEADDTECKRKYSNGFHQLIFPCGPIAGLLLHYWTFQLELLMTVTDVQENIIYHSHRLEPSLQLNSKTTSAHLVRDRAEADETAQSILQAEPYVGSCFEGLVSLQSPLRIVARYFEQSGTPST